MKHTRGLVTAAHALRRTFIPIVETSTRPFVDRKPAYKLEPRCRFYMRRPSAAENLVRKLEARNNDKSGWVKDEDIQAYEVQIVNEDGKLDAPILLSSALESLDRSSTYLVQLSPATPVRPAVCKAMSKRQLREQDQMKAKAAKEAKQPSKQIELNWSIDAHDLSYRLKQLESFLDKGRKVEVLLTTKKRKRLATQEEAQNTLETIRRRVQEIGAEETKPADGKILRQLTLFLAKQK